MLSWTATCGFFKLAALLLDLSGTTSNVKNKIRIFNARLLIIAALEPVVMQINKRCRQIF